MPVSLSHSEIRVSHQVISRGHPPTKDLAVMLLPPLTLEPLPVHRQLHLLRPQELSLLPFLIVQKKHIEIIYWAVEFFFFNHN